MQSILQILKRNDPKAWSIDGKSGFSHSAECIILTETGEVAQVGVLKIKGEKLQALAQPGTFYGTFAMQANPQSRIIEAVVVDLTPIKRSGAGFVPVESDPAKKAA